MKPIPASFTLSALAAFLAAAGLAAPAQDTNSVNPKDFSAFKIITERNIFDPNRRPSRASTPRVERTVVDSLSLAGTLSYSNVLLAIFDGTKSDYHRALKTGESIAGHALARIDRDAVTLSAGTNELQLKVGMQLRRSEDGKWSVAEAGSAAYASSSRRRSERTDSDSSRSSNRRTTPRGSTPPPDSTGTLSNTNATPDPAGEVPPELPPGGEVEAAAVPTPDAAADSNDPVARMMARRLQEMGGTPRGAQGENSDENLNPRQPQTTP
jgi:hypothetical protein